MKLPEQTLRSRLFAMAELCGHAIEIGGQRLEPDATKAYVEFKLAHGFTRNSRVVTAFGTTFHPGTVSNSYRSMQHQVLSYGHQIKAYNAPKQKKDDKEENRRDYVLGSIVGVEYPPSAAGWTVAANGAPAIRAAAVIHKQLEKVPAMLGEHLGGRHQWTVSLEVDYSLLQSGFIVGNRDNAKKKQSDLLNETTPQEFNELGLGYVTLEQAPDDLLECFDLEKRSIVSAWYDLPVVLLKGGINGNVHFKGVGMVRYGAEKQAEIQQILATDPNQLAALEDDGLGAVTGYFENVVAGLKEFGL